MPAGMEAPDYGVQISGSSEENISLRLGSLNILCDLVLLLTDLLVGRQKPVCRQRKQEPKQFSEFCVKLQVQPGSLAASSGEETWSAAFFGPP